MATFYSVACMGMVLSLAGCAAPSPTTQAANSSSQGPAQENRTVTLRRGASAQAVREALGTPTTIEPVKDNPAATLWTYRRAIDHKISVVEATLQDSLVFDPTNLQTGMAAVKVPTQQMQETVVEEILVLIMVDDQLADWNRSYREVAPNQIIR